jgi:hypothetical protein
VLIYTRYILIMRFVKGDVMHSRTKTGLLLVAFMLLSLGWPQLGWSTAYSRTIGQTAAQGLRDVTDKLQREFYSARTSPYGVFVQRNLAAIGGVYALFALLLLLKPRYRDAGWERFGALCFWRSFSLCGLLSDTQL